MNNEKMNLKIKLSNNSSFVILSFVILKFRNIGRSIYVPSFQILTSTRTPEIFNNFSSCEILIFPMVELIFYFTN